MSIKRKATAVWQGSGKEGSGHLTTKSTVLNETQYSFQSRFAEGIGTNPEELLAAAHAGCFCMKLSFVLGNHGFTPERLEATCTIELGDGKVDSATIVLDAHVPGISIEKFKESISDAAHNCPISRLFNTRIVVKSNLKR